MEYKALVIEGKVVGYYAVDEKIVHIHASSRNSYSAIMQKFPGKAIMVHPRMFPDEIGCSEFIGLLKVKTVCFGMTEIPCFKNDSFIICGRAKISVEYYDVITGEIFLSNEFLFFPEYAVYKANSSYCANAVSVFRDFSVYPEFSVVSFIGEENNIMAMTTNNSVWYDVVDTGIPVINKEVKIRAKMAVRNLIPGRPVLIVEHK